MPVQRLFRLLALSTLSLALAGCAFSGPPAAVQSGPASGTSSTGSTTAHTGLGGRVYGGQSPITGAAVTLWAAGTTGTYGTGASQIATTTTDMTGSFSFNAGGVSPCTTGQYLYITSVGGNTGSGTNQYAAAMAALPTPCNSGTGNTFVVVNEATTVASVAALQQFMGIAPGGSPAWTIGAPSANVTGMANAFTQVGNLVNTATGASGPTTATNTVSSVTYSTTITPDTNKIYALADVLSACINTNGSGTGTGTCAGLFAATTPTGSVSPTDTIQVAYYLATNAGGVNLPVSPAALTSSWVTATSPFQPYSTSPTDWTVDVNWKASNGTATVGTANAASVAIDGSGNIWTAAFNSSTTGLGVTEFNPAGQVQFTPATTAPVVGGWNYATCGTACNTAANLGGTHQGDALAIDISGNAWASSYNSSTYTIVTSQPEQVVVKVTPTTGAASAYLVGSFPNGMAIDGSNDIYVGDDSSTTTNRYYEAELVDVNGVTTPYSTFEAGSGRTAGNGDYYIGASVDETSAQYVWPWSTACQTTIPRITNSGALGTASVVGSTATPLPAAACFIAADAFGNAWVSAAPTTGTPVTALEYVNVEGNTAIASPVVTTYTQGTNGAATGSQLGGGLFNPQGVAIDGEGNLWVVNANGTGSAATGGGISEFVPSNNGTALTPLSPSGTGVWGFFSNTTIGAPTGAAIDGSGNVWLKTRNGSFLYYLVGVAAPVVTPLANMVKTGFIAERPGAQALASLTSSLNFSALTTGNQAQTAMLTNTGTAPVKLTGTSIGGTNPSDFTVTGNTCGSTLAIGANCSITVTFAPTTAGSFSAALNVNSNAVITPSSATLTGTASATAGTVNVQPGVVPPTGPALSFGPVVAPSVTTPRAVVLMNTGATTMSLTLGTTGTGANLFPESTNCSSSLAAGASCFVSFEFGPKVAGSYSAALNVTNDAGTGQGASLSGTATAFTITVNTSSSSGWTIDNGAISFSWNATTGNLTSWILDGTSDQLVDTTTTTNGQPYGLYMDNTGSLDNASVPSSGGVAATPVAACTIVGATQVGTQTTPCTVGSGPTPYIDWSLTVPDSANSGNAYTFVEHWIVFPNDPGVHTYVELVHSTSDAVASVGQIQWVFRDNLSTFTNTYSVNAGLNILGVQDIPQPPVADTSSTDPGRAVQNAAEDLHGFNNLPAGFTRQFYTKYDYAGYEYLHQGQGTYGPASSGKTYGIWTVMPKLETLVGGPTKQNLFFTNNLDMIEAYSDHENEALDTLGLSTAADVAYNRLFGPFYIHVNTLGTAYNQTGNTLATQADMYADAISAGATLVGNYDNDAQLVAAGYVPSIGRGSVSIQVSGIADPQYTAWAVLSDPAKNFQVSTNGMQYWADISNNGTATISGVAPGTYRLSVYVLGQWGEYRQDGIVVTANNTTTVPMITLQPENFAGATGSTVFTIGTPDRSAHEFLHGHTTNGNDDREFYGNWNYWMDFAANSGAVVYYATADGSNPATNNLNLWNYNHWGTSFDPGLYAGVFNASDDTTDGYSAYPGQEYTGVGGVGAEYAIPTYVAGLPGASGTNGTTTGIPSWQVHFATPANFASETYVVLSVAVACDEGSYVVALNSNSYTWSRTNESDCMVRSGLSGYTQWFAMQWPTSALNQTVGGDNVITIGMSQPDGASDDALRLELTNTSAAPATTGWNDYTFLNGTTTFNNDAIGNP